MIEFTAFTTMSRPMLQPCISAFCRFTRRFVVVASSTFALCLSFLLNVAHCAAFSASLGHEVTVTKSTRLDGVMTGATMGSTGMRLAYLKGYVGFGRTWCLGNLHLETA